MVQLASNLGSIDLSSLNKLLKVCLNLATLALVLLTIQPNNVGLIDFKFSILTDFKECLRLVARLWSFWSYDLWCSRLLIEVLFFVIVLFGLCLLAMISLPKHTKMNKWV